MALPMNLHPDRLFPADAATRGLARRLYATVKDLPIVSPHGHTDPQWFADDTPFAPQLLKHFRDHAQMNAHTHAQALAFKTASG